MKENSRLRRLIASPLRIGLGGEGVLRTEGKEREARAMLMAAYESGIRYFDSAPAYAGSEGYLGQFWADQPERKDHTFQASKSAKRDANGASEDLARSLSRLHRDHLDLWQIHDLRTMGDIRQLERPGGALREFYQARENGTVRGIGATGHYDPAVLLHAVTHWDIDSVLLPVNPVEAAVGGFIDRVITAARDRDIGVIGMKVLGAGNYLFPESGLSPESLIHFALSRDVDLVIVGCSNPAETRTLAQMADRPASMDEGEQARLIETVRPYADRLAYYRGVI
ncbi:MAG: aldo/keto reductase [Methanomicrobiales archaeon]|nr:aldo/keto reductase [Methanomicrobiales archaeon]